LRERRGRLLRRIQRRLERFYHLERTPDVLAFVRDGGHGSREALLVRDGGEEIELALMLPPDSAQGDAEAEDLRLQLVEGVSHFVYIAERARTGLPATQLELELQAEVDKFVLLALETPFERLRSRDLHFRLYECVRFLDPPGSEAYERYRLANDLAARFVSRVLDKQEPVTMQAELRRFYRLGQTGKISLAAA
jgi:hypothetical protein